jgi:hypothetical protein
MLWVFGNSPIRPDGKGFLTYERAQGQFQGSHTVHTFHDWHGKQRDIKLPPLPKSPPTLDDMGLHAPRLQHAPFLYLSRWQKGVVSVEGGGMELVVDTAKLTMRSTDSAPYRTADGQVVRQCFTFEKTGMWVRVSAREPSPVFHSNNQVPVRVDVLKPNTSNRKTLIQAALLAMLQPSPDGQMMAIRCLVGEGDGGAGDRLFVIDARGQVLADIDTFKQ